MYSRKTPPRRFLRLVPFRRPAICSRRDGTRPRGERGSGSSSSVAVSDFFSLVLSALARKFRTGGWRERFHVPFCTHMYKNGQPITQYVHV
eukprot:934145-Amorphochlora_amoeboformis.AAC.1